MDKHAKKKQFNIKSRVLKITVTIRNAAFKDTHRNVGIIQKRTQLRLRA